MATRTLLELMNRASYACSETFGPDKRHTPDVLLQLINESLQRYHAIKNQAGQPPDVTRVELTTSASATTTLGWPLNSYVTLPADFKSLVGAQLLLSSSAGWVALNPFDENEKALIWDPWGTTTGPPTTYRLAKDTSGNDILRLLPAADSAYTIEVVYVSEFAELDEGDNYEFVDGTEAYVVCDVAMQMLENADLVGSPQYGALMKRRDEAERALKQFFWSRARAGVEHAINTRGAMRRQDRRIRYWR